MKWYKKFLNWLHWLFSDEKGNPSSKRFVGLLCGLSLCIALFISQFTGHSPSDNLVDAVAMLAFGCLGLTSLDKIFFKRQPKDNKEQDNSEPTQ
jgi:hypothetical protein